MAVGHVRADDEEHLGTIKVLIAARRSVGPQRLLVAAAGAGHAQARVGFDVAAADEAFGQFVDQVLGLQRHLPGDIEPQGVGPMFINDRPQALCCLFDSGIDAALHRVALTLVAQVSVLHAPGLTQRLMGGQTLGAQAAKIAGVQLVTTDLGHPPAFDAHDDATTDATIRAHAAHAGAAHRPTS
ncbi:hypothetical protein D3C79_712530 [compost metagenome]